jgi:hypothetical protein
MSKIRELNDTFRRTFAGGRLMMSAGVAALNQASQLAVCAEVKSFDTFTGGNDPHGEHDFGGFDFGGDKFFWKIDYYTPDLEHGSEDPSDPTKTTRVLTIMLAEEY